MTLRIYQYRIVACVTTGIIRYSASEASSNDQSFAQVRLNAHENSHWPYDENYFQHKIENVNVLGESKLKRIRVHRSLTAWRTTYYLYAFAGFQTPWCRLVALKGGNEKRREAPD